MNSSKGLGRGLEALIGTNQNKNQQVNNHNGNLQLAGQYQEIAVDKIVSNPGQPRRTFGDEALAELAASIKAVGIVQPVVVRRAGGSFEIIAGERRWRAARMAGLKTVPAVIRDAGDAESVELALIENLSREDLNPIDAARAYANLQEDFGITQEELAAKLGRSRSAVANTLRLLDLPDDVQTLIEHGRLSEGHGRALLSVPDRLRQRRLAAKAAAANMSVRQLEARVKREAPQRKSAREASPIPAGQELMDEATDALYSAFRLPVKVRWSARGGRIEMEFRNNEELRRIIDSLEDNR